MALDVTLPYPAQAQQQTNWCWAAIASATSAYYGVAGQWPQCAVANAVLGQTTCCANGSTPQCNQRAWLGDALQAVGHLDFVSNDKAAFDDVKVAIGSRRRPLGVRLEWAGGGFAHFVAIAGYSETSQMLDVEDPWQGPSQVPYDTLASGYLGSVRWTHTFFTIGATEKGVPGWG